MHNYSFEAHLLHSGLQMIWKRLNVTTEMDAPDLLRYNKAHFEQVSEGLRRRFGVFCHEQHMKEASEMLHYAFHLNIPKSHYIIVHHDSNLTQHSVTMDDAGNIVPADADTEWTEREAHAMLTNMRERWPRISAWLEKRIPRYVTRTLYGDF